jgi:hypothetical protein
MPFGECTVFDALTQTDSSGRYRLAIPPGRYYIGAGSVNSPKYYPNTTNISSAKAIVVSADSTLEDINFSQYIAPALGILNGAPPLPLVTLPRFNRCALRSHPIRRWKSAAGVPVLAVPSSVSRSVIANSPAKPRIMFQPPEIQRQDLYPCDQTEFLSVSIPILRANFDLKACLPRLFDSRRLFRFAGLLSGKPATFKWQLRSRPHPPPCWISWILCFLASTGTTSIQGSVWVWRGSRSTEPK